MKTLKHLSTFCLFIILIAGCQKDNPNPGNGTGSPSTNTNTSYGSFSAIVVGEGAFSSNKIRAEMQGGMLTIVATSGKTGFAILLNNPKIGANLVNGGINQNSSNGDFKNIIIYAPDTTIHYEYFGDQNATVNVTSYNTTTKNITGTFDLTMLDSTGKKITVTAGKFDVHYSIIGGQITYTYDGTSHTNNVSAYKGYTIKYDSLNVRDSIPTLYMSSNFFSTSGGQYPRVSLEIPRNIAAGSYPIGGSKNSLLKSFSATLDLSQDDHYYASYYSQSIGTLTITQNDLTGHRVVGSFTVTLTGPYDSATQTYKTKQITNGSFDVTYQ